MFGSQAGGGSLFGQKPATGGGLFGSQAAQPAQPQQTSGSSLFGATQPQQQQQQQQQQPQQSTPFGGGGLFGAKPAQQQPQQQPQQSTPFGGGGLFGAKPAQQQPQQQSTSFGGGGLFGPKPPQQQQAHPFGTAAPLQPQQQQQQQQQQSQVPIITPFTRPSDLPESFQKELENMDNYIRQQAQLGEDLSHSVTEHRRLVASVPRDVQLLNFKLTAARETLRFDDAQLAKLRHLVECDASDAELLVEITSQPRRYDRLLPYFQRVVACDERLQQLAVAVRDVQQVVTAEEFGKRVTYDEQGVRALPQAMREEYMYFMSLADRVAELHRHIEDRGEGDGVEDLAVE